MTASSPPSERAPLHRLSVVAQLTLIVSATLLVLLGALLAASYVGGRKLLREQIDDRLTAVLASRRDYVVEWVGRQEDRVDIFASRGVLRNFLEKHVARQPEEPQRTQSQENLDGHVRGGMALSASIVSREGTVLLSSDPAEAGRDLSSDRIFQAGLSAPAVGLPERVGGRFVSRIAAPTRWLDNSRAAIGVVMLTVDATPLAAALRSTAGLGSTGEVLLGVQTGGRVHYLFPPRFGEKTVELPADASVAMKAATEGRGFLNHTIDYRGQPVIAVGQPVGHGGWGLVVKIDEREAYAPIGRARDAALALGGAIAAIGLAGAYMAARSFARPIRRLVSAAQAVAGGDLSVNVPVRSRSELGLLTRVFNEMVAALRSRAAERRNAETAVRASEARYRLLADHTDDCLSLETIDGKHLYISPSYFRLTGWTIADLATSDWRARMHPDDLPVIELAKAELRMDGEPVTFEHRIRCRDGRWIWVEQHAKLIADETGAQRRLFWCHEITARKHAESALGAERNLLRTIIDALPISIYLKDVGSRFLIANEACAQALGAASPAHVLGRSDADFFPAAIAARFRRDEERVLAGESLINVEEESVRPDGAPRIELTTKVPLRNSEGEVVGIVGVSRDITERKHAEESVRESEALLRSITDHTEDVIFVKDIGSRTIFMNPAGFVLNGLRPDDILGRTDAEFIRDPDQAARFLANDRFVLSSRQTLTIEEELTMPNGETRILLTTKTPRYDADGRVIGLVGIARDITTQKRAEAALRESEQRLRTVGDNIPHGAIYQFVIPSAGPPRFLYMSAGVERLFGIPSELVLADSSAFWSLIVKEDLPRLEEAQSRSARDLTLFDCEFRQRTARGEVKWLHARSTPRRLDDGSVLWDGVVTDITERKAAEDKLRESNQRYELVATGTAAGIWDWDIATHRVFYSARWAAMRGYRQEEVGTREEAWSDGIHPEDRARVIAALRAHVAGDTPVFSEEYRIRCKDGSWRWVHDRGIALRDAAGIAIRMAGSEIDITVRREAEEEIKASLREKEVLLREVHHRVKNNLQIVSSLLNLQARQLADPALIEVFSTTRDRVRAMAAVHERLYESGNFARIDFAAHLTALVRALTRAHAPAGMRLEPVLHLEALTVDLNTAVPLSLIANELILNALKYAFAGRTHGTLRIDLLAAGQLHAVRIADDGPGLPPSVDPGTTRTLGLRLVRDLAKQIRGELQIDSQPSGTNIILRWPARPAAGERELPAEDAGL